jgi:hypothetical protein
MSQYVLDLLNKAYTKPQPGSPASLSRYGRTPAEAIALYEQTRLGLMTKYVISETFDPSYKPKLLCACCSGADRKPVPHTYAYGRKIAASAGTDFYKLAYKCDKCGTTRGYGNSYSLSRYEEGAKN